MNVGDQAPVGMEESKEISPGKETITQNFPRRISEYREVRKLGSGTYGDVFEVQVRGDRRGRMSTYALKVQDKVLVMDDDGKLKTKEGLSKIALVEVDFMKRVSHPCLHSLLHCFVDSGKVCFLSEKAEHHLNSSKLVFPYTREETVVFIHQLFSALEFIHGIDHMHCDLKGGNCLVFGVPGKRRMKLCDFGVVQRLQKDILLDKVQATFYRAPEVFRKENYGKPSDIWAAGMLLFEFIFGLDAAGGKSEEETFAFIQKLQNSATSDIFTLFSDDAKPGVKERIVNNARYQLKLLGDDYERIRDLIKMCVVFDPEKRVTASQALALPLFTERKLPRYKGEVRALEFTLSMDSWKLFSPVFDVRSMENFPVTTIALALDLFDRISQKKLSGLETETALTLVTCLMLASKVSADFAYSITDLEFLVNAFVKPGDTTGTTDTKSSINEVLREEVRIVECLDFVLQPDTLAIETWPEQDSALKFLKALDKQSSEDIEKFRKRKYKEISVFKS